MTEKHPHIRDENVNRVIAAVQQAIVEEDKKGTLDIDEVVTALVRFCGMTDGYNSRLRDVTEMMQVFQEGVTHGKNQKQREKDREKENAVMYG